MSRLLCQPPKLCFRKLRASPPLYSDGFPSSLLQSPPCYAVAVDPCKGGLGKLIVLNATEHVCIVMNKKVPMELVYNHDSMVTIGASNGWVATLKDGRTLRLQDDLNPYVSDPKCISLPPLVTLPNCQTQIVTNVTMSTPSPEDEDCVVAVKFLGHQLSFCRPGQSNPQWTNIKIQNPSFLSSPVMFSKKHNMFMIPVQSQARTQVSEVEIPQPTRSEDFFEYLLHKLSLGGVKTHWGNFLG